MLKLVLFQLVCYIYGCSLLRCPSDEGEYNLDGEYSKTDKYHPQKLDLVLLLQLVH